MRLDVEFKSSEPLYIQIMEEFKRQIVSGRRRPGDKVEPVRDLARELEVNPGTVQRAFAELEREGLLFPERTSGRYITADESRIRRLREQSLRRTVADFVGYMRRTGVEDAEILRLVGRYLEGGG